MLSSHSRARQITLNFSITGHFTHGGGNIVMTSAQDQWELSGKCKECKILLELPEPDPFSVAQSATSEKLQVGLHNCMPLPMLIQHIILAYTHQRHN